LRNKIYIPKNHNTHVQNSHKGQLLTTEPLTWVHTQHKPLKQVRHRWQQMTLVWIWTCVLWFLYIYFYSSIFWDTRRWIKSKSTIRSIPDHPARSPVLYW